MPDTPCPFTTERLSELLFVDHWRPEQIAVLAGAATGRVVSEVEVLEWLRAAGIETEKKAPIRLVAPKVKRPGRPAKRSRRELAEARKRDRRELAEEAKRGPLPDSDNIPDAKHCARPPEGCGSLKPIREFPVDASRSDLHARVCLVCRRAKNRAYYEANRERLKAKAAAYQRERRANG